MNFRYFGNQFVHSISSYSHAAADDHHCNVCFICVVCWSWTPAVDMQETLKILALLRLAWRKIKLAICFPYIFSSLCALSKMMYPRKLEDQWPENQYVCVHNGTMEQYMYLSCTRKCRAGRYVPSGQSSPDHLSKSPRSTVHLVRSRVLDWARMDSRRFI